MKRMIFHIPNKLDEKMQSGSQIRPVNMMQAFENIGYQVDVVMGYCSDRKVQISKIKENIRAGVEYDFLYSESSTMPTALTEKHHLPTCPFLDFDFFKFCKNYNIKIGLFYRDIHWGFEQYKNKVPFLKRKFAEYFYRYDLKQYAKYLDILYLPSREMFKYIPMDFQKDIMALPPAAEKKDISNDSSNQLLSFIYVGGLGEAYDLKLFARVIDKTEDCTFHLCTREKEWKLKQNYYSPYKNNISIHHKNGKELENVYNISNIAILFIKATKYWKFVMAVKLFEYISYKKPIIAVKGTTVGDFVEKNNIGWVINYDEKELSDLIVFLQNNPQEIENKIKNIGKIIQYNTWEARALQVEQDLTKRKRIF